MMQRAAPSRRICEVIALIILVWALPSNEVDSQQLRPIQVSKTPGQQDPSAPGLEFEETSPATPAPMTQAGKLLLTNKQLSAQVTGLARSPNLEDKSNSPTLKTAPTRSTDVSVASFLSESASLGLDDKIKEDGDFVQAVFEIPHPNKAGKPAPTLEDVELAEQGLATGELGKTIHEADTLKESIELEQGFLDTLVAENFYEVATEPFRRYRSAEARISYLAASSRSFGWTSIEWEPYLKREQTNGLTGTINHHFLSGPRNVDLPPILRDFILGYQHRGTIGGVFSFDCAASVGVFSDFKGSAREGVRFPAHAVGIIHASHRADLVFGVDYLDRDDYKILPVLGISWHDLNFASLRYDLIFPRPRIDYTIDDGQRVYLAGRLGGGTWDFENPDGSGDVMNLRDFRVLVGHEKHYLNGSRQAFELGYVFDRQLTLRESAEESDFRNAFVIQLISTY